MGSRTGETLNEIDEIRGGLEAKLTELQRRLPPAVQWGRRALGGVGGGVVLFALKRYVLSSKKSKKKDKAAAKTRESVVVVKGGVSAPAALGVAAIWAAIRVFEAKQRGGRTERPVASVKPIRDERGA